MHTLWHIQVRLAAAWANRCLRNDSWDKSLQISSQVRERHVHPNLKLTYTLKKTVLRILKILTFWLGGKHMPRNFRSCQPWHVISLQYLLVPCPPSQPLALEVGFLGSPEAH